MLSFNLADDFSKLGVFSGVICHSCEQFIDCCVINHRPLEKQFEVVSLTAHPELRSWMVFYGDSPSLDWHDNEKFLSLPFEIGMSKNCIPRLQMLMDMGKSYVDVSGIDAYEKSKEEIHQRIQKRHRRHQSKRKRRRGETEVDMGSYCWNSESENGSRDAAPIS
ncbi:hypothetical protein Aperf_G00000092166 [Anoplocephala perfoliata]